ncbi:MAG TPA: aldo/keto reductase [Candidatus Dormibacteraeota bacterium]|nr:aldo/keto reductase [Candidatus Dormibacteraeota bacterium]
MGRRSRALRAVKPISGAKSLFRAEEADKPVVDRLGEIAKARGIPRAQIALAWLLHKPAVTAPIVSATKPHHLEEVVVALDVKLSDAEIEELEATHVPHRIAGFQ